MNTNQNPTMFATVSSVELTAPYKVRITLETGLTDLQEFERVVGPILSNEVVVSGVVDQGGGE